MEQQKLKMCIRDSLKTGFVPNFPTLLVSGFVALAAIVSFFTGLILSTIIEKEKQEFEFHLNLLHMFKEAGKNK